MFNIFITTFAGSLLIVMFPVNNVFVVGKNVMEAFTDGDGTGIEFDCQLDAVYHDHTPGVFCVKILLADVKNPAIA